MFGTVLITVAMVQGVQMAGDRLVRSLAHRRWFKPQPPAALSTPPAGAQTGGVTFADRPAPAGPVGAILMDAHGLSRRRPALPISYASG